MKNILTSVRNYIQEHEKLFFKLSIVIFVCISIIGILHHEPWYDEAQSWLVAQNLSFPELLKYLRYEGHFFVWYTLLMPFAKLNFPYPYTMQIINWVFALATVIVLWKKAPFNTEIKILITFSAPIFYQYAVVARCYSVGLFLLFLLLSLYKDKLKHPYLYSLLIFLCANTNICCLFPASVFGFLFFFDYIKEKKNFLKYKEFYIILFITVLCVWVIGYQTLGAEKVSSFLYVEPSALVKRITNTFCLKSMHIDFHSLLLFFWLNLSLLTFKRDKKVLFLYLYTTVLLFSLLYFLYTGKFWHYYFFYIYLLISIWLYNINQNKKDILYKSLIGFFVVVSLIQIVKSRTLYEDDFCYIYDGSKSMAKIISVVSDIKNHDLYVYTPYSHAVVPFLNEYNIPVKDCYTNEKASFFDYRPFIKYYMYDKSIINMYLKNKTSYIIIDHNMDIESIFDIEHWDSRLIARSKTGYLNNAFLKLYLVSYKKKKKVINGRKR